MEGKNHTVIEQNEKEEIKKSNGPPSIPRPTEKIAQIKLFDDDLEDPEDFEDNKKCNDPNHNPVDIYNPNAKNHNEISSQKVIFVGKMCEVCQLEIDHIRLECDHYYCIICLYNDLEIFLDNRFNEFVMCKKCKTLIEANIFKDIVPEDTFMRYLQRISQYDISTISGQTITRDDSHCKKCGEEHKKSVSCVDSYNGACCKCNAPCPLELPCKHKFCSPCLLIWIKSLIDKMPMEEPHCTCNTVIPTHIIYQVFGGKHAFINFQQLCIENTIFSPYFTCNICTNEYSANHLITLDCNHRFCENCLQNYLINKVMSSEIREDELVCPECGMKSIDYNIIKAHLPEDILEKYHTMTIIKFQVKDGEGEVMKWCRYCSFGMLIDINEEYFDCPNCNASYCPKCNQKHFREFKCPNLRKSLTGDLKSQLGSYYEQFMKNMMACPNCNEMVIKDGGCNFIKCVWPTCNDVYFCAICRKRLSVSFNQIQEHFSHYKLSGPYGATCNTTDRIDDPNQSN